MNIKLKLVLHVERYYDGRRRIFWSYWEAQTGKNTQSQTSLAIFTLSKRLQPLTRNWGDAVNCSQVNRSLIKSWRFPYTYFTLSIMSVDSGLIFKRALIRKVQQSVCFWKRPLIQQLSATGNKTEQICSRISTMAICKLLCTVNLYFVMVTDIRGSSSTSGLQHWCWLQRHSTQGRSDPNRRLSGQPILNNK